MDSIICISLLLEKIAALHCVPKSHGCYEGIDERAYQLMRAVYREHHRVKFRYVDRF